MQTVINDIVRHLFRKGNISEVEDFEIRDFVTRYPYSSVGHYLLAHKKLLAGSGSDVQETTTLYFNNHLWLQRLLNSARPDSEGSPGLSLTGKPERGDEDNGHTPAIVNDASQESILDTIADAELIVHAADDLELLKEQENTNGPVPFTETSIPESGADQVDQGGIAREQYVSAAWEPEHRPVVDVKPTLRAPIAGPSEKAEEAVAETEGLPDQESLVDATDGRAEDERPIAFQSYHTIDYFASQGIRLTPTDLGGDKLGQQLKSFTDWLRSMKKLQTNAAAGAAQASPEEVSNQIQVSRIAEYSIREKEIVTEAMAEVWAKQGNIEKATAIYSKLSLLNPHKNAYFAAKIEQLKDL